MKKLFPLFLFALLAVVACDNDDDRSVPVPDVLRNSIEAKYPGAVIRRAEYENNGLLEVEVIHDARIKDIYFNRSNEWVYTEWDVTLLEIPASVVDAVKNAYPGYRIDEADYEERPDAVYYKVQIELGESELYLNITPEGEILTSYLDGAAASLPSSVLTFIETKYPGAVVRGAEYEGNGLLDIAILHDMRLKEVYFDSSNEWLLTEWDVLPTELPVAVVNAVTTNYPNYRIDDADYEERPLKSYYELEIERGNFENVIYVTAEGEILETLQ